jgi:hypothetical protein
MSANQRSESQIVESWTVNAIPWTNAVRERKIESRRLVTDAAIVDLIRHRAPTSIDRC